MSWKKQSSDQPILPVIPTLFKDLSFYILGLSFSETTTLKSTIKQYGGDVAFQINKNVKYLLTTKESVEKNCIKITTAIKSPNTEIISINFINHCINKRYIDYESIKDFILYNKKQEIDSINGGDSSSSSSSSYTTDSSSSSSTQSIETILSNLKLNLLKSTSSSTTTSTPTTATISSSSTPTLTYNQIDLIKIEKKQIKLFISSTFLDMEMEREYLIKYLVPEIRDFCNNRDIDFNFVDMRWGISDSRDIEKKSTIATCLEEVNSSNYFISLIGDRYGWCEGPEYDESFKLAKMYFPWIEKHDGKSITELEILQSLSNSKRKSSIYFKSHSSSSSSSSSSNDSTTIIETPLSKSKLDELKLSLNTNHSKIVNKFTTIENLISQIYTSLITSINSECSSSNQTIIELKKKKLNFELLKNVSYCKSLLSIEFVNNYSFDKLNQFIIKNQDIYNSITDNPKPFLLSSSIGGGKSTVLSNWIKQLSVNPLIDSRKTLVVCFYIGITPNNKNSIELLRQLFSIIKHQFNVSIPLSDDPESIIEEINYWYGVATKDGKNLIIIYDSIDTIEKDENQTLAEVLSKLIPMKYPSNVKIVLSCYNDNYQELVDYFQLDKEKNTDVLTGFVNEDQVLQFSRNYLSLYSKELSLVQVEILKKYQKQCSDPLFLSSVLGELVTIGSYNTLNEKMIILCSSAMIFNFYMLLFQRWESDTSYPANLVTDVLQLIYLSENGLYEDEILSVLGLKSSFGFFSACRNLFTTIGGGSNYFKILSPYLKLSIALKYFSSKVENQLLPIESKLLSGLSDHFENRSNGNISRKIEYLPRILKTVNDKSKLQEFLLDLENINQLSKSEIGKTNIDRYWNFIGINSINYKEIINLYKFKWAQYCNTNPPLEELASTTFNIGSLFQHLSMYEDAYQFIEKSQEYHIQLYGDCHSTVENDLKKMVLINIKLSNFDKSEYQAEKLLSISESIYGKENIGIVESLILNGQILKKKTNYQKSLQFYKSSLFIIYRYLGYNQSDLNDEKDEIKLSSDSEPIYFNIKLGDLFQSIGDIYRKLGKFEISLKYYSKTLKIYNNLKKSTDICFSELYKNLGLVHKKNGNYQESIENYEKSLSIIESIHGKQHVEYGFILCDIADALRKQEKLKESESLYFESLEILKSKLNQDTCIEIAEIYNDLGLIRKKQSQYKEAIEFYKKSITIALRSLGKSHLKISFFNLNLADCYRKIGDYKTSESYYSRCLLITQENLGYDHIEVAEILNSIGLVYKKQSKYQQAESQYKRAIIIIVKSLGSDHFKNGIYMNNLGDCYRKLGNYEMAKTYYGKAQNIISKSLGKQHSEYAEVLYCQGLLQFSLEQFDLSIDLIKQAIEIITNQYSANHVKIGIYSNSLADVFVAKGKNLPNPREFSSNELELNRIRSLYSTSLQILKTEFGTTVHPEIADIFNSLAEFEFTFGSHTKSLEYFKSALEIIQVVFDESHVKYQQISDRIRYF